MDHHLRALILHSFIQKINCTIIFFHPDCNCWSRSFTESAPVHTRRRSRTVPPVGNFTPPLRLLYILSHFKGILSIAMRHLVSPRQKFTLDSNIKAQLNGLQSAVCGLWVKSRTDERFIPLYFAPPYVILNPDKQTEATA